MSAKTSTPELSLPTLLTTLTPLLQPDHYIFATLPTSSSTPTIPSSINPTNTALQTLQSASIMTFYEAHRQSTTFLVRADKARNLQNYLPDLSLDFECRQIIIDVHSGLAAVGFMAVLTRELAGRGISANVVSGFYSDHLFVPVGRAEEAVRVLEGVREEARARAASEMSEGKGSV